ncbi:MAG TPA: hypothetical protein VGL47_44575 [Amycolatopsis sp.]
MNRKIVPIGPLAIVLRRVAAGRRVVVVIAAVLCAVLLAGIALLVV